MRVLPIILVLFSYIHAAKILVYSPIFGYSHTKFLASIAEILTEENHDVTVLMPVMETNEAKKHCLKKTKKRIFLEPKVDVNQLMSEKIKMMNRVWTSEQGSFAEAFTMANKLSELFAGACEQVIQDVEILEKLKAEKFDLGIVEPFSQCGLAVFNVIGLDKYVSALSSIKFDHLSRAIGEPIATSFVPGTMSVFSDQMTLKERLLNTIQTYLGEYVFTTVGDVEFANVRKYHPDMPDWRELVARSTFVLPNTIPFLDFPAPTLNKIVPIGGVSVNFNVESNNLPEKWDKVLNERKHTVFISFGSNAKSVGMPDEFKKSLIQLFTTMSDVTFIWKYENEKDTLVDHLQNVHLGSWLPQNELLADKRLSLFITHGGLASIMELSFLGKPSIVIPLFADQYRNARMLTRHGGALTLAKEDIKRPEIVKKAIQTILDDESFLVRASKLSNVLRNQPTNARDTLIKHVEFAARFGQQPLTDPYGRKLNIIQYFLIDALFLVLAVLSVVIFILFKVAKLVVSKVKPKVKVE